MECSLNNGFLCHRKGHPNDHQNPVKQDDELHCFPCTNGRPPWRTSDACWEDKQNGLTDRCKNVTLPETSFAGGNSSFQ